MPRTRRSDVALRLRKVRYEKKGHIAFVTIDNAKHENCLEEQVDHDLWDVWRDFRDDPKLYVAGLTQRLPHIVGLGVALDLLITGRWFDAREAYRIHFVNRVVRRARLMAECTKLAEQICEYPQSSLRTDKEACIRGLGLTLEEGLRLENTLWNTNLALPDTLNGPRAFIEKRRFVPTQEV